MFLRQLIPLLALFLTLVASQGNKADLCAEFENGKKLFGGPFRQSTALNKQSCAAACKAEDECQAAGFFASQSQCLFYSDSPTDRPDLVIDDAKAVLISFGECEATTTTTTTVAATTTTTTTTTQATTTTTTTRPPNPCANFWDYKRSCGLLTFKGCCVTDRYWMDHYCQFSCCQFNLVRSQRFRGLGFDLIKGPAGIQMILTPK